MEVSKNAKKTLSRLKPLWRAFFVFVCLIILAISIVSIGSFFIRKYFYPLKYKEEIFYYADYYGLDRALIFALVKTESGFDKDAISKANAFGLMQITENTANFIANKLGQTSFDLFIPETNINFGCYYLRYLINKFEVLDTALVAYNAGEGNVYSWLKNKDYSMDGKSLYFIPFSESNEYIQKIHKNFEKYKKLYENILDKSENIE